MYKIFCLSLLSLLLAATLFLTTSCGFSFLPIKYDVGFSAHKENPVYIEKVIYDDTWYSSGGILSLDWKEVGKIMVISPRPVPKKIFIRWFNYKQQWFYEATVPLPENTEATLRGLPKPEYGNPILTIGVLPDGGVVIWVGNSLSERTGTWIEVARVQGHQAEGNPYKYKNTTEDMRARGEI